MSADTFPSSFLSLSLYGAFFIPVAVHINITCGAKPQGTWKRLFSLKALCSLITIK
jgi:hypothetical protein